VTVDLKEEQDTANEYQNEVKLAEAKAVRFDLGEALLEISVGVIVHHAVNPAAHLLLRRAGAGVVDW